MALSKSTKQEQAVLNTFNAKAEEYSSWYDGETLAAHSFQSRRTLMLGMTRHVPPGKALDIGCGPGVTIGHLLDAGHEVWGVDIAQGMIDECRKRFAENSRAHLSIGKIESLD